MKKSFLVLGLAVAMMSSTLVGCGSVEEKPEVSTESAIVDAEAPVMDTEEAVDDSSLEVKETIEAGGMSADDVERYMSEGLTNNWEDLEPADLGLSSYYKKCSPTLGYARRDLDGDGREDFVIGENVGENASVIYDIFTTDSDGNFIHLASGKENDVYYIYDGRFFEMNSVDQNNPYIKAFAIKDAHLVEDPSVDAEKSPLDTIDFTPLIQNK